MELIFFTAIIFLLWRFFQDETPSKEYEDRLPTLDQSLIWILAYVMEADGKVTKNELNAVKKFLISYYPEEKAKNLLLLLRDILKREKNPGIDIRIYCIRINEYMNYNEKLGFLTTLFKISIADGLISDNEAVLLQHYARFTRIRDVDFLFLTNYYTYGYQWGRNQDNRGRYRQRQQDQNNAPKESSNVKDKAWAYKTLGLPNGASSSDVKKAYRALAQQYHPDKQVGKSDAEIAEATNKFREINEAYNLLLN